MKHSALLLLALGLACSISPAVTASQPQLIGEGTRVLFIGNSYTYSADVPGIVQAMAEAAGGTKLAVATVAGPDRALADHWSEGTSRREIAKGGWQWVVLQQGPSSTTMNRDSLRLLTGFFAAEISRAGGRTALFSAWPAHDRRVDFPRAIESYTLAAADVNGTLLPVAQAWKQAWDADENIGLYVDGLHPSSAGAYLAGLVIYARLLGQTPKGLPSMLRLRSGAVLSISQEMATALQALAAALVGVP